MTQQSRIHQIKEYYEQNEHHIAILFFIGGFLFDMMMVGRIDSWETIGQQVVYLLVIMAALLQMFFEETKPALEFEKMFILNRWY
jgi:hypothetical protein